MSKDALSIIEKEIERLKAISEEKGLDLNQTKQFEILLKSRAMLTDGQEDTPSEAIGNASTDELLNIVNFPTSKH